VKKRKKERENVTRGREGGRRERKKVRLDIEIKRKKARERVTKESKK
jgi:hypothetical protein